MLKTGCNNVGMPIVRLVRRSLHCMGKHMLHCGSNVAVDGVTDFVKRSLFRFVSFFFVSSASCFVFAVQVDGL